MRISFCWALRLNWSNNCFFDDLVIKEKARDGGNMEENVHHHTRHMITTRADEEEWNSMIAIAKSAASVQLVGVGNAR
jgi:hypothetical protein